MRVIAAIGLSALQAGLLVTFEQAIPAVVIAVLIGIATLFFTLEEGFVAGFLALFMVSAAGFFVCGSQDYPLFGATVGGISVAQAPANNSAAIFGFTDGQVLADMPTSVAIFSGSKGTNYLDYYLYLVPIVPDNWQEGDAVPAWAVSEADAYSRSKRDWAQPYRRAVRLVSLNNSDLRDGIASAGSIYGLTSVPNAPLVRWLADPQGAVVAARWHLWDVFAISSVIWAVLLLGVRLFGRLRGRPLA